MTKQSCIVSNIIFKLDEKLFLRCDFLNAFLRFYLTRSGMFEYVRRSTIILKCFLRVN